MARRVDFLPGVADLIGRLGERDREIVSENIAAVLADPAAAGYPSGLRRAKPLTSQHTCPHSFAVLYRWQGLDPQHAFGVITIEDVIERL